MQLIKIPTGFLFVDEYSRGKLETLSIADYGKAVNVKADFLGLTNEINGVPNAVCMPLSEKWVITLSTQYGCSQKCRFCLPPTAKILMHDLTYKEVQYIDFDDKVICNVNGKENKNKKSKQYATLSTTISKVTGLHKRKYDGLMYKLTTKTGKVLTCTDEHPVAVKYKSRILFQEAKELRVGDFVVSCGDYSSKFNNEWAIGWLHGFMDGDGVYDTTDVDRCFVAQNDITLLEFAQTICKNNGVKTTNIWKNGADNYRFGILGKNLHAIKALGDKEASEYKRGYLAGYWDAEGFSFRNNLQYRVCDTDITLVNKVKNYLNFFGYTSNYSITKKGNCKDLYVTTAQLNKDEFIEKFEPRHKKRLYLTEDSPVSKTFCDFDEVVDIESYHYTGFVYNFETEQHNYYAENVLTHNCDVPKIPMRGNATFDDLHDQFKRAINVFGGQQTYTERLNLHFARMGEPIYNKAVFEFAEWLYNNKLQIKRDCGLSIETLHPVLTTCLPSGFKFLEERVMDWCRIKNEVYNGQAGFQFSINSTNEDQRTHMFNGGSISLEEFAKIADKMPEPISRKYCLNFAYATGYEVDGDRLAALFDPAKFMCKITPIHNNDACRANGIETIGGYETYLPYKQPEESLKAAGFDVLVFVPSMDEEDGLVTCGNLVLSGSQVKNETDTHKIDGLNIPVVDSVF